MTDKKDPKPVAGPPTPVSGELVAGANKQLSPFIRFKQTLDKGMDQIKIALPRHIDPIRFYRVILTAVQQVPKPGQMGILDCTQESVFSCMLTCAQLGLEPNGPQGHAYLIPFRDKNAQAVVCTLVIGFKGLIKLARNSGEISGVAVRVVHEHDRFEYEFGLNDRLWHVPTDEEDPGPVTHAYAVWKFKDGGYHFDVMTRKELDRIKNRKSLPSFSPWTTDEEEMQKKTVLRRSSKMVPNSIELARGLAADDRSEEGLAPVAMDLTTPTTPAVEPAAETKAIAEKAETLDDIAAKAKAKREAKEKETVPAAAKKDTKAADEAAARAFGDKGAATTVPHDATTGEVTPPAQAKSPAKSTDEQRKGIAYLATERGVQISEVAEKYGAPSTTALTFEQATEALEWLRGLPEVGGEPGSNG